ncbi:MAG: hypothetical protein JSW47_22950, partial [Phycisphaerales bacterium]
LCRGRPARECRRHLALDWVRFSAFATKFNFSIRYALLQVPIPSIGIRYSMLVLSEVEGFRRVNSFEFTTRTGQAGRLCGLVLYL